jgi:hypothetical protein
MGTVMTQREQSTAALDVGSAETEPEQTGVRVTRHAAPGLGVEMKLARARSVIAQMAPADPRARLLHVAMLRRDEILLEALLRRLDPLPPY